MNTFRKRKKTPKAMPSAVLLSILIHAALFLLAGMLVVFTVVKKKEIDFEPPKAVERPKMKLKKPKVKVKKSAQPKKAQHILTKVDPVNMPEIQLPEGLGGGMGEGFGGDVGGFDMMPDMEDVTVFGGGRSIGNDLVGTFYDLKRDRAGRPIPYSMEGFLDKIRKFIRAGFKSSVFARYYQSPQKLYTSTIMMPPMLSCMAPIAFGDNDTAGVLFLVHYKGQLVHKDGITFRFYGSSGDGMLVGVDGKVVLNACWIKWEGRYQQNWRPVVTASNRKYMLGFQTAAVSEWITLKPGEFRDIDILLAEAPGGGFSAELLVEEKGVEYEHNSFGAPILPVFKTAELSLDQMDSIYINLVEGEACLTNGPIFSDYNTRTKTQTTESDQSVSMGKPELIEEKLRLWTSITDKSIEAEFVTTIAEMAVLKNAQGKQIKIPLAQLCGEDRMFIELNSPPAFEFDFAKKTSSRPPIDPGTLIQWIPPRLIDYTFTAKVKQTSPGSYNHELKIEYFAIGEEVDGDNYILLDRQEDVFTPTKENKQSHAFSGPPILCYAYYDVWGDRRGMKYGGYLITLTDSRGKIIAHGTPKEWLFENLDKLRQLPIGKHFDKNINRVFPPRPKRKY